MGFAGVGGPASARERVPDWARGTHVQLITYTPEHLSVCLVRKHYQDQLLYRPKEANALGMSKDKLYDLIRAGRISSVKDGRARFITADGLTAYLRQLEAEPSEAA